MPKMKTKSALTKRIKVTASGKVKRGQAFRSHNAQPKTNKQKRQARNDAYSDKSDLKRLKGLY